MKKYNCIMVFDINKENILMCLRKKNPYQGLWNLPGGKVEPLEDNILAAYRELQEETGITKQDIELYRYMDLVYYDLDIELQVYTGILKNEVTLIEEINSLAWTSIKEDFNDISRYAGNGNISHILRQVKIYYGIE